MERAVYRRLAEQEDEHWWFAGRRRIVERLIARHLPPVERPALLDVGCGTGGNLALLMRFGKVAATEYDAQARQAASEKSGLPVGVCELPGRIDAPDAAFDLVLLLDVLEHVEDDVAALAAAKQKLGPGGRLLLTVPALPFLWSGHDEAHHHFRRYTRRSAHRAAQAAGLRVVASGYFCTLLFPIVLGARLAKRALGRRDADDRMPGPAANAVLRAVFAAERHAVGRVPMPIGSSLYLVAE
jgi:SAM-dependent methyltransferase